MIVDKLKYIRILELTQVQRKLVSNVGVREAAQQEKRRTFSISIFEKITNSLTNAVKQKLIKLTHPPSLLLLPPKKLVYISSFFLLFSPISFLVPSLRSRTTLRISSFIRRYLPFKATLFPVLRVLRVLSSTSFSRRSLRAKIASVSRSSAKLIKSRISTRAEIGISSLF